MRYVLLVVGLGLIIGAGCATNNEVVDIGDNGLTISISATNTNEPAKTFRKTDRDGNSYLIKTEGNTITYTKE